MQSWFFCIINSVFSVSRFMVCVFISLCVFVCVRDRSLRLLAVWWADQSSRRCSSWLVFLCGVVRSLLLVSCLVLGSESEFRRAALSVFLCRWPEQLQVQLVVGVFVRCCQIVVARVLSCSRVWVWVSPGCSVCVSLSLTRAIAGAARGWCFCAVLSDRCQIVVARVLSCSRSLLLVPESEFRRAALSVFLCRWPEQLQVQLVVGVSVRCCQIAVGRVLSCSRSLLLVPESEFRRAALSLILCRWPEQSQVQFVVGVSVRCCQIVVARVLSCSRVWVCVSPGCSVCDSWRGRDCRIISTSSETVVWSCLNKDCLFTHNCILCFCFKTERSDHYGSSECVRVSHDPSEIIWICCSRKMYFHYFWKLFFFLIFFWEQWYCFQYSWTEKKERKIIYLK